MCYVVHSSHVEIFTRRRFEWQAFWLYTAYFWMPWKHRKPRTLFSEVGLTVGCFLRCWWWWTDSRQPRRHGFFQERAPAHRSDRPQSTFHLHIIPYYISIYIYMQKRLCISTTFLSILNVSHNFTTCVGIIPYYIQVHVKPGTSQLHSYHYCSA